MKAKGIAITVPSSLSRNVHREHRGMISARLWPRQSGLAFVLRLAANHRVNLCESRDESGFACSVHVHLPRESKGFDSHLP
jgi:hypothetical protein